MPDKTYDISLRTQREGDGAKQTEAELNAVTAATDKATAATAKLAEEERKLAQERARTPAAAGTGGTKAPLERPSMRELESKFGGADEDEKEIAWLKSLTVQYEALERAKIEAAVAGAEGRAAEQAEILAHIEHQKVSLDLQRRFRISEEDANQEATRAVTAANIEREKAAAKQQVVAATRAQIAEERALDQAQRQTAQTAGRAGRGLFRAAQGLQAIESAATSRSLMTGLGSVASSLATMTTSAVLGPIAMAAAVIATVVVKLVEHKKAAAEARRSHADLMDELTGRKVSGDDVIERNRKRIEEFTESLALARREAEAMRDAVMSAIDARDKIADAQRDAELAKIDADDSLSPEQKVDARLRVEQSAINRAGQSVTDKANAEKSTMVDAEKSAQEEAGAAGMDAAAAKEALAQRQLEAKKLGQEREFVRQDIDARKWSWEPEDMQLVADRTKRQKEIDARLRAMAGKRGAEDPAMEDGFQTTDQLKEQAKAAAKSAQEKARAAAEVSKTTVSRTAVLDQEVRVAEDRRQTELAKAELQATQERKRIAEQRRAEEERLRQSEIAAKLEDPLVPEAQKALLRKEQNEINKAGIDREYKDRPQAFRDRMKGIEDDKFGKGERDARAPQVKRGAEWDDEFADGVKIGDDLSRGGGRKFGKGGFSGKANVFADDRKVEAAAGDLATAAAKGDAEGMAKAGDAMLNVLATMVSVTEKLGKDATEAKTLLAKVQQLQNRVESQLRNDRSP